MKYVLPICAVTTAVALAVFIDHTSNRAPSGRTGNNVMFKVYATGRVEGSSDQIELRPRLAGAVARVNVEEDQVVKAGDVLIELDNNSYVHQVSLAIAEVQIADAGRERLINGAHPQQKDAALADYNGALAEFKNAETAWKRIASLRTEHVISQQEADDKHAQYRTAFAKMNAAKARLDHLKAPARQDELRAANAKLAAANSRLELARAELEKTRLRAPRDGRVLALDIEQGEIAGPQSTQPAVVMVDTTRLRIRAFVEELDAPRIRPGMPAKISVDGIPGQIFVGRVTRLSPQMSRKRFFSDAPNERFDTKVREVWIELERTTGLFVGLRVDVMIDPDAGDATESTSKEEPSTGQSSVGPRKDDERKVPLTLFQRKREKTTNPETTYAMLQTTKGPS